MAVWMNKYGQFYQADVATEVETDCHRPELGQSTILLAVLTATPVSAVEMQRLYDAYVATH